MKNKEFNKSTEFDYNWDRLENFLNIQVSGYKGYKPKFSQEVKEGLCSLKNK